MTERPDAIARAFLLWLSEQTHEPDPLEFLASQSVIGGDPAMPAELEPVVRRINQLGLLRGHWREGNIPGRLSLTERGRECVTRYDGCVAAWVRAQRT